MANFVVKIKLFLEENMSIISRVFYSAIAMNAMLFMPISGYASSHTDIERVPCPSNEQVYTELTRPQDPTGKTQLSITLNGVYAKGYSSGIITKLVEDFTGEELLKMPESDQEILDGISTQIETTCVGSGKHKSLDLKSGMTHLDCNPGDGLLAHALDPTIENGGEKVEFTITTTRDDDEVKEGVAVQKNGTGSNTAYKSAVDFKMPSSGSQAYVAGGGHSRDCSVQ